MLHTTLFIMPLSHVRSREHLHAYGIWKVKYYSYCILYPLFQLSSNNICLDLYITELNLQPGSFFQHNNFPISDANIFAFSWVILNHMGDSPCSYYSKKIMHVWGLPVDKLLNTLTFHLCVPPAPPKKEQKKLYFYLSIKVTCED